jgi:signal transduction histidine kinase
MKTQPLVLYADDERANLIVFEQSFNDRYRIRSVSSGEEALAVLATEPVAVVVTDQRMPGMSGNDLLRRVLEVSPDTIRIVITAYSDLDPILRAVNEGLVARYVIKPWDHEELRQILDWGIETYEMSRTDSAMGLRLLSTERLSTLGSLAGAVLHDLNEPLSYLHANALRLVQHAAAIPHLVDLVTKAGAQLSPEVRAKVGDLLAELPEISSDMRTGCEHIGEVTRGVGKLLSSSEKRASEDARIDDPLAVVRYATSVVRGSVRQCQGTLVVETPEQLPAIRMYGTDLTQILVNLLANAAQALSRRQTIGGTVRVRATASGEGVAFEISDDGPGMPPDVLAQAGKPFFSTRPDGTGLGLSQCRRLIERACGHMQLHSVEGQGTTVSFALPLADG